LIFTAIFMPIRIWLREPEEEREYGRDKIYPLPLPVCSACRPKLNGAAAIKASLNKVQEYQMLLDKFPDAKVSVSG
jgi:hypothetical protein